MKIKLLVLTFLGIFCAEAQTTHDIDWKTNSLSPDTDKTIALGDTVRWTWKDAVPHTVTNDTGSTETFNSLSQSGINYQWSWTFTEIGTNPYLCLLHGALSMSGTITVQTLGIEGFSLKSFKITPNPSSLNLNIELPSSITNARVEVFDVLGKQIYNKEATNTPIDISDWSRGVYLVRISTSDATHTKRFIKQ